MYLTPRLLSDGLGCSSGAITSVYPSFLTLRPPFQLGLSAPRLPYMGLSMPLSPLPYIGFFSPDTSRLYDGLASVRLRAVVAQLWEQYFRCAWLGGTSFSFPHTAHPTVIFWLLYALAHLAQQNCRRIEANVSYALPQFLHVLVIKLCVSFHLNIIHYGRRNRNQNSVAAAIHVATGGAKSTGEIQCSRLWLAEGPEKLCSA